MLPARPVALARDLVAARFGRHTPLKVTHLLTYRCNVACGFCTRIHVPSDGMEEAQVLAMMDAFAALGTRYWVFNGGEPTLVKSLGRYVERARALGMHRALVTNGVLLERRADELAPLDLVIVSVHGDREEHDRVVGERGAFDAAMRGLRALGDRGVELCLLVVLHERNRALMDRMLTLGESIGASVGFQPVVDTRLAGAHGDPELLPARAAMAEAVDWLLEQKALGRPVSCSTRYLDGVRRSWPDQPFGTSCWAGRLFCEVTPEGYVVPCCAEEEYLFAECHGPTVGWGQAFAALPDRSGCQACWFKGPQELNLLLGLEPRQLARGAMNAARGRLLWD